MLVGEESRDVLEIEIEVVAIVRSLDARASCEGRRSGREDGGIVVFDFWRSVEKLLRGDACG